MALYLMTKENSIAPKNILIGTELQFRRDQCPKKYFMTAEKINGISGDNLPLEERKQSSYSNGRITEQLTCIFFKPIKPTLMVEGGHRKTIDV